MANEEKKITYFQYQKELDFPIFVACDLSSLDPFIEQLLIKNMFTKLMDAEAKDVPEKLTKSGARLLNIVEATPGVVRQIDVSRESDRYGLESITPKEGYRLYRLKGHALMVYSFASVEWEVGVFPHFGENEFASQIVINRFLGWALSSLGIIGFWGTPVEEGIIVMNQKNSEGEAVFVDIRRRKIFTKEGTKTMKGLISVIRLDNSLKGRNVKMRNEELISFMSHYCTYFDFHGLSVPVRQMIHTLSKLSQGIIHPLESFKPRMDLGA